MRGLSWLVLLSTVFVGSANAQDSPYEIPPFVYEITKDHQLKEGFTLNSDGVFPLEDTSPCSYKNVLGLERELMCPPTTVPDDTPEVFPKDFPCKLGMCPPTVGLGGNVDPLSNLPLKEVLPKFKDLKIQTY